MAVLQQGLRRSIRSRCGLWAAVVLLVVLAFSVADEAARAADVIPPPDKKVLERWREAMLVYRRAGKLIGQEEYSAAADDLRSAADRLPMPYSRYAKWKSAKVSSAIHWAEYYGRGGVAAKPPSEQSPDAADEQTPPVYLWSHQNMDGLGSTCVDLIAFKAGARCCERAAELTSDSQSRDRYLARAKAMKERAESISQTVQELRESGGTAELRDRVVKQARKNLHVGINYDMDGPFVALFLLSETAPHAADDDELFRIRTAMIDNLKKMRDHQAVVAWEDQLLIETAGNNKIAARVTGTRAERTFGKRDYDTAVALYREIIQRYPDSREFETARLRIATCRMKQRRFQDAIAEYQAVLDAPRPELPSEESGSGKMVTYYRNGFSAALGVSDCLQVLGRHEESLAFALRARNDFVSQSGWGTHNLGWQHVLNHKLDQCYLHVGQHATTARRCLETLQTEKLDHPRCETLFRLYRDADQLDDLAQMVATVSASLLDDFVDEEDREEFEKGGLGRFRHQIPLRGIGHYLWVEKLRRERDVAALIEMVSESADYFGDLDTCPSGWHVRAVAEALAACGDPAFQAITKRVDAELADVYASNRIEAWAAYALGRMDHPGVMPWLKKCTVIRTNDRLGPNLAMALALRGEAGLEVLRNLVATLEAEQEAGNRMPTNLRGFTHQRIVDEGDRVDVPPPKPAAKGTLPKQLPVKAATDVSSPITNAEQGTVDG